MQPQWERPALVTAALIGTCVAYSIQVILLLVKWTFSADTQTKKLVILVALSLCLVACLTQSALLSGRVTFALIPGDRSMPFVPALFVSYMLNTPSLTTMLSMASSYTHAANVYVEALKVVMLLAGLLGTVPGQPWGCRVRALILYPDGSVKVAPPRGQAAVCGQFQRDDWGVQRAISAVCC